ncbi:Embryonic stem cell-specific 5-hydroxymethylcytosine-binding protein [Araneus ventricosus]|uniref:Abasic site processing protein HMCES n=1 Tax=Araneus ventricosus TaxID=182803 RepID=A0A4Y2L2J4_ARAVE|nr:Embryonic stem cell-specific 5-hydroxymethylcytosine-binding protein [Araneus ventricosus]
MCGRTACTLDQCEIKRATRQYSKNKDDLQWIQKYDWQNYKPNYNFSPTQIGPVIVNGATFSSEDKIDGHALTLMRWGLIPSWYKGNIQECFLKTNNCRHEGILEKPTFRGAAAAGRRCIVLADGFYEWKEVGNKRKQPYFIYFPQEEGPEVFTRNKDELLNEKEWKGPRLLTMAGLFDVWKSPQEETYYSYSVITLDSSKTMSFVHSRMPAILNGTDEVSMWLDTNRVPTKQAISILKPVEELQMHPVSTVVGNSRNNTIECIKPYKELEKRKNTGLTSWLIKGDSKDSPAKRFKPDSQE